MKIPKYVYELVELGRLRPAPLDEQANSSIAGQGEYGFMFRVYRQSHSQSGGVFVAEVERITAWARREYAESNIHTYRWYTDKEHRKPYYKRDYALVTITDPVAQQLEKRVSFRRAMKQSIGRSMKAGAKGIKMKLGGRLGGAEIARSESYHEGSIPLQTLRANIDYGFAEAHTTYGNIGVKVWIYKGQVLPTAKKAPKQNEGGK